MLQSSVRLEKFEIQMGEILKSYHEQIQKTIELEDFGLRRV